ncbi:MAG: transmembrane HD family protein, partial [Flavobacterium sp.]
MAKIKKNSHKVLYRKYSSNLKYVMMAMCVLVITLYLPKQPRFRYEFEKGKTWLNKDLISPFSFAILKTPQQIELDKKTVLENILPIYEYKDEVFKEQSEAYLNEFDVKWKSNTLNEAAKEINRQRSHQMLKA